MQFVSNLKFPKSIFRNLPEMQIEMAEHYADMWSMCRLFVIAQILPLILFLPFGTN